MHTTDHTELRDTYKTFENLIRREIATDAAAQFNLAQYGADAGYAYLTWYDDVEAVYNAFESEILDTVEEFFGEPCPVAFVGYAKRKHMSGTLGDYLYFLVHAAAEIIASRLADSDDDMSDTDIVVGTLDAEHEARMVEITKDWL